MDIPEKQVTAFIGPSGCGKSTLLRCFNRMNDLIDNVRIDGAVPGPRPGHQRARHRRHRGAPPRRHGVPEVEPAAEVDLRERRVRPAHRGHQGPGDAGRGLRAIVEGRGAVGRGEGPARHQRPVPLGRPAAAPVHRARDRHRARDHPDGRALLGARPDRHGEDRGADLPAEGAVHDRHRDPQPAAGGAGVRPARRSSGSGASSSTRRPPSSSRTPKRSTPRTTSRAGSGRQGSGVAYDF